MWGTVNISTCLLYMYMYGRKYYICSAEKIITLGQPWWCTWLWVHTETIAANYIYIYIVLTEIISEVSNLCSFSQINAHVLIRLEQAPVDFVYFKYIRRIWAQCRTILARILKQQNSLSIYTAFLTSCMNVIEICKWNLWRLSPQNI